VKYFTFQPQFHQSILAGVKTSTIRPKQKIKPGERFALRFWTGKPYRSPMGFLGTAECLAVARFSIDPFGIKLDGKYYNHEGRLAKQEGFESVAAMRQWFADNHGETFEGFIHSWANFAPASSQVDGGGA
jgi:hypothetical protein